MKDFAAGNVVELPASVTQSDAVVHIFEVHEVALVQQANLLYGRPAKHETGAGYVPDFDRGVGIRVRRKVTAQGSTQEKPEMISQQPTDAVAAKHFREAR